MSEMAKEEAKKVLENLKEHMLNYQIGLALDTAITALSGNKWIPVSERLPENTDDVLVTDGADMFVAWYITNHMWKSYDEKYDEHTPILAWQPLPDPYKEGD